MKRPVIYIYNVHQRKHCRIIDKNPLYARGISLHLITLRSLGHPHLIKYQHTHSFDQTMAERHTHMIDYGHVEP